MLFKNVIRALRQKWMQLAAIGVIVTMASLTYTMMFYGISGIAEPTQTYLDQYVQEDFSVEMLGVLTDEEAQYPLLASAVGQRLFTLSDIKRVEPATFTRLVDGRIKKFEDLYPETSLELRQLKLVEFERDGRAHSLLAAKDAERINLSFMEAGTKPVGDDEIALNQTYAEKNGYVIGDYFELLGRRYRITGFVLFPDYTLTSFDNSLTFDSGLQGLALLSDYSYSSLDADETFRLSGISEGQRKIETAFDSSELPFVTQIIPTSTNFRSGAIHQELTQGRTMSLGLSIFIAAIAVVIVSIMMSDLLYAERGQIGILKALGALRSEIAWPYFLSVVAMAFVMLVLGYVLGVYSAEPLKRMYLDFYLLPQEQIVQTPTVFVTAVFVPLLFFGLFSAVVILRILGEGPLELLKPKESDTVNLLSRFVGRLLGRARAKTKFRLLHAVGSTGSFLVFFVGIMFSTLLILYALMMSGMVEKMTVGSLDAVEYRYQAYLDPTKRAPDPGPVDERFLQFGYAYVGEKVVTLHGLEPDNALYNLHDVQGVNITGKIRDAAVVTKSLSLKLGVESGDTLDVKVNDKHHQFVVAGVSDEYSSDAIYVNIETLSRIVSDGRSDRLYSGIYSTQRPSAEFYKVVMSKQALIEQSRAMATYTSFMINVMIGSAGVIAASILFALTSFSVERNYYSISLLKVLGYSRREVNSMVLDSYLVYSLVSYAISVPITIAALDALTHMFLQEYNLVLPLALEPLDLLWGLVAVVAIFLVGTIVSRRKIARIPLQEVLKAYGE